MRVSYSYERRRDHLDLRILEAISDRIKGQNLYRTALLLGSMSHLSNRAPLCWGEANDCMKAKLKSSTYLLGKDLRVSGM
jgi:hypothetical protein